jgi:chromosome segregation ATPase
MMASCGRIELVVLRSRREVLKGQMERHGQEIKDLRLRIEAERATCAATNHTLAEERSRTDVLGARIAELQRQLVVRSIETEILTRRVQELDQRLEGQPGLLAKRESEAQEPATVRRVETLETSGRVGPDVAALASRQRSQLLVTFRKALAVRAWSRIGRSLQRNVPETRLAASG